MSDLHKPIGVKPKEKAGLISSVPVNLWLGLAAVILVGTFAWMFIDARDDGTTVVAVNEATQPGASTPATTPPATATARNDGAPAEPRRDANGNIILDLSEVKPLSPLDPLPDAPDGTAGQPRTPPPAFQPRQNPAVVTARRSPWLPVPDNLEESEFGRLPKIAGDGTRPLDIHSASSGTIGANRIALVLGGLGLSQTGTQDAIRRLPEGVTLAFSPQGNSLQRWMQAARRAGHEVALQLPMEPLGYPAVNPGPQTLNSKVSKGANLKNLRWSLGRMTNYPTVINYLGAGMLSNRAALEPILQEIRARGLAIVDDGSVQSSDLITIANDLRLPHAKAGVIIDRVRDADRIRAQLRTLEAVARQQGNVIATATAFPQTVEIIEEWAKSLNQRGILLVPLSNLVRDFSR